MRVLTTLPQEDLRKVPEAARQAEADGYDGLLTLENRNEPFLSHAVAAVVTERIGLGTGVAIAFARSPMAVANLCWDLQIASRGRFVLGLGPQIRPHNEKRFSVPWSPPVPRLREYVKALRAIWTCWEKGEKLDFRGEHYTFTLMTPNFVPASLHLPMVPITLAGFGTYSLRLSGEVGDGLRLHPLCTRRYLEEVINPRVAEGLEKSGKARENFEVSGGGFLATGRDDEAVHKMAEWVRMRIAFYGSTPAYWPVLELHGLGDLGRKLNALSKEGKWDEMTRSIPDDFLHLCAAIGRHDEIAGIIETRFGNASDTLNASVNSATPSDMPPDLIKDIQRIPTLFKGFKTAW
jgi:probable F420-dependent oxidoreductase